MTLGTVRDRPEVSLGDTAVLRPYAYDSDDNPVPAGDIASVSFTVKKPDGTQEVILGTIEDDGSGFASFGGTDQTGLYRWVGQFTFLDGSKRSFREEFSVYDPFADDTPTRSQEIADEVWMRFEDAFDAQEGGPWLRQETMAYFDKSKIERFIPEGLMEINVWPPDTNLDLSYFTIKTKNTDPAAEEGDMIPDPDRYLLVLGTELAVIRHLMRSYVEQPAPQGANIVFEDRRDYLQRWQMIYQMEEAEFRRLIALWKRQFLKLGKSALLVHSKAGRLYPPGAAGGMRARNAVRGY